MARVICDPRRTQPPVLDHSLRSQSSTGAGRSLFLLRRGAARWKRRCRPIRPNPRASRLHPSYLGFLWCSRFLAAAFMFSLLPCGSFRLRDERPPSQNCTVAAAILL